MVRFKALANCSTSILFSTNLVYSVSVVDYRAVSSTFVSVVQSFFLRILSSLVSSLLTVMLVWLIKVVGLHSTVCASKVFSSFVLQKSVAQFISNCFICRKLRGKFAGQIMSDLPEDRAICFCSFHFRVL